MSGYEMSTPVAVWVTRLDIEKIEIRPVILDDNTIGLDAVTTSLPGGAYTTLRTYQGNQVLRLRDQVVRLEQSARLAGKPFIIDESKLRLVLRSVIAQVQRQFLIRPMEAEDVANLRLRLTLDLETHPGDLYIATEPLDVPLSTAYLDGVAVITCTLQRLLPEAKLTRFISRSAYIRQSLPLGINEAVMVNPQGFLLEGLTSNFFAVTQSEVHTAGDSVLAGITRGLVLECAHRLGIPVRFQPTHISELASNQESFITSASRGVLPVCQVDGIQIGSGKPGLLTHRLMQAYGEMIMEQIEPV